jgi:hypothetical protein
MSPRARSDRGPGAPWPAPPVPPPARGHRWRWVVLLLATAVAAVGFWAGGMTESDLDGIGLLAVPLFVVAGYLTSWWALPCPAIALVLGVVWGTHDGSVDNEYAGMNYAAGLVLCEAAALYGDVWGRRR